MGSESPSSAISSGLTALLSAGFAAGALYGVGHAHLSSYYAGLGLPPRFLEFDHAQYAVVGFQHAIPFLVGIGFAAVIVATFFAHHAKVEVGDRIHHQNLLGYGALAGLVSLATALADVNTQPFRLFGWQAPFTSFQVVVVLVTALFATTIVVGMTTTAPKILRSLVGHSFSGQIFLALVATVGLIGSASIAGTTRASDELWNLVPHFEIRLDYVNGTSEQYFFVAHTDGAYFVRDDSNAGGRSTGVVVVPESSVVRAEIFRVP